MQNDGNMIARPRLFALLESAIQSPLALVHAGTGYGKTLGASMFLAQSTYRTVWMQCSPLDNLPSRFWATLTTVFAHHRPTLGEAMQRLEFPDTLYTFNAFLSELTAQLYQDDQYVVFVFDDVHLITEGTVLAFLANLISARLENNCILLLTRNWPLHKGIPTPTLPITADALRFTPEETGALFAARGLPLEADALLQLHAYTAGWPIALSMAALALQQKRQLLPAPSLPDAKPALFALFEQEIFSQYTPKEQALLIQLSVLTSFPRGLVQAVSGEPGRELGALLDANSFIQYDPDGQRLSFHPLYREFLQEKRIRMDQSAFARTYCKAGDWCLSNGLLYDALTYYGHCGNHEARWETLLRFPGRRRARAEADFLIAQIESLPEDFRKQHPMADIARALLLANNLRMEAARASILAVQAALEADTDSAPQVLGECYTARGLIDLTQEEAAFGQWFERAAELLPHGSTRWGKQLRLLDLSPGLSLQSAKPGALKRSLAAYTRGIPPMVRVLHGTGTGLDHLVLCEARFLTGEPKAAEEPAFQALYAAQQAGQHDIAGNALLMLLRIYSVIGDYTQVQDILQRIDTLSQAPDAQALGIWDIARGWVYSDMDPARMPGWLINTTNSHTPPISMDRELLLRVRWMITTEQGAEALALLDYHERMVRQKKAVVSLLYTELYRAVILHRQGRQDDALRSLRAAYRLARDNRLVMPFIAYGHRTRALLERALAAPDHGGIPAAWLEDVHARASTCAKRHAALAERWKQAHGQVRPRIALTKREQSLLSHLSQGLTREEIAQAMQWSLNTVKSTLTQVYGKLGAINRADAIRIAVQAGLL